VSSSNEHGLLVTADCWLATLILERPGDWADGMEGAGEGADRRVLRHGHNTVSYLSPEGAWIVCGPWRGFVQGLVDQAMERAGWLACASVQRQWRYRPGSLAGTARALTGCVCREIPMWDGLDATRKQSLTLQMEDLVTRFLTASADHELAPGDRPLLESYSGQASISTDLAQEAGPDGILDSGHVEAHSGPGGLPNTVALDYWWQSVFTMWWKGFW